MLIVTEHAKNGQHARLLCFRIDDHLLWSLFNTSVKIMLIYYKNFI